MFKKALQITIAFGLLLGAYRGYVLGFGLVSARLNHGRVRSDTPVVFVQNESKTAREASRLAAEEFGKTHWSAKKESGWRVYDSEKGYYLYYQNYERLDGGKKVKLWPFAMIWNAKDGKSRKTATSLEAFVDLNEPLGIVKPNSSAMHVVHAKLVGDVRIRDDRGTVLDPSDDLFVGPLTQIEYDEPTSRIFTASQMEIRDRNLSASSRGMIIDLRKTEGSGASGGSGFEAKTATLLANVHILVRNVGASGILPGTAKGSTEGKPTPLDARCDSELRIDFPVKYPPLPPTVCGPPRLEGPTLAVFHRNVQVVRGTVAPDQLNSDILRLTLVPMTKVRTEATPSQLLAATVGAGTLGIRANSPAESVGSLIPSEGPLTELTLNEANAVGHAVWLQSKAQGLVARCNELIYKKLAPDAPDETYLRGDPTKQLYVEKLDPIDPENPKAPRTLTTILALDAKIFDDGQGGSTSTVIARGPGRYESRSAADKPVDRSAWWREELILRTTADAPGAEPRRRLTLTGKPKLVDHAKGMTLTADRSVVAGLKPRPPKSDLAAKTKVKPKPDAAQVGGSSDSMQLEWMQAKGNVVLVSPGKTMSARDQLDATFADDLINPVVTERPAPPANAVANPFGPVIATKPASEPAKGAVAANSTKGDKDKKAEPEPAKAVEPAVTVHANRVWAKIRQRPEGEPAEILEAMLRGAVNFHQDAAPGKARGLDVTGEAVDVVNQGDGLMKFKNYWQDPSAANPSNVRLASNSNVGLDAPGAAKITPARIITDERFIEGKIIGLDQKADFAWVDGEGQLIQMVEPGLMNEKGLGNEAEKPQTNRVVIDARAEAKDKPTVKPAEPPPKVPFTIVWSKGMKFFGQSKDLQGRPAGKAEFRGDVKAWMEDAILVCVDLDTYTDRIVKLDRSLNPVKPDGKGPAQAKVNDEDLAVADDSERPELAFLDARGDAEKPVVIIYAKRDPISKEVLDQQRIQGKHVLYDKRTGEFSVPGSGLVYLWRHRQLEPKDQPKDNRDLARQGAAVPVAGRDPKPKELTPPQFGPWEATKITFNDLMKGRFGAGKDRDQSEPRIADFYGQVQTMTAKVAGPTTGLSFDRMLPDAKFLTADSLRVVEVPPDADAPKGTPAEHWMTAVGESIARDLTHVVSGDRITYDSTKELFYAYGKSGREVVVIDQKNPGQAYSNARGQDAWYNHKTGAAQVIQPSTLSLLDGQGARPGPVGAPGPETVAGRKPRPPLRPPTMSNMERRGFTGR